MNEALMKEWREQYPHRLDLFVPDEDELYFSIRPPRMSRVSSLSCVMIS